MKVNADDILQLKNAVFYKMYVDPIVVDMCQPSSVFCGEVGNENHFLAFASAAAACSSSSLVMGMVLWL